MSFIMDLIKQSGKLQDVSSPTFTIFTFAVLDLYVLYLWFNCAVVGRPLVAVPVYILIMYSFSYGDLSTGNLNSFELIYHSL